MWYDSTVCSSFMSTYCYLNGKIIPFRKASLKLNDLGVLRGYGVFDYLRTYHGKPLQLEDNLKRFRSSAKLIGLSVRYPKASLERAISTLIKKNRLKEASVRMVLTGGPSSDFLTPEKPTLFILATPFKPLPGRLYKKGGKLITYEHLRQFPEAKSINYITAVKLQKRRRAEKAIDILYTYRSKILECSVSNFFMFIGNTLVTPKQDILNGITRRTVMKLASKHFAVIERAIRVAELSHASEMFITAANKMVLPIVQIDDEIIGTGKVGKNTRQLMQIFAEFVEKN